MALVQTLFLYQAFYLYIYIYIHIYIFFFSIPCYKMFRFAIVLYFRSVISILKVEGIFFNRIDALRLRNRVTVTMDVII